jgi:ubiquinone/menaquinone biosynthesis C-methylase UbiE
MILRKAIKNATATKILDVGCADGGFSDMLLSMLKASSLIGIDLSVKEIHFGKNKGASSFLNYIQADVTALPISSDMFDLIFAKDLLHHLSKPTRALCEFKRVLKRNASLIIVEADRANPFMSLYIRLGHNHFTIAQLSKLIRKAGLKDYKVEKISAYPHHFLFISKNPFDLVWDSFALIFLSVCSIFPSITTNLAKLVSSLTPYSYNIIIWRNEE